MVSIAGAGVGGGLGMGMLLTVGSGVGVGVAGDGAGARAGVATGGGGGGRVGGDRGSGIDVNTSWSVLGRGAEAEAVLGAGTPGVARLWFLHHSFQYPAKT